MGLKFHQDTFQRPNLMTLQEGVVDDAMQKSDNRESEVELD
jgi:hypothetical protein